MRRTLGSLAIAGVAFVCGCSGGDSVAALGLTTSAPSLLVDGSALTITAKAIKAGGGAGSGTVQFTVPSGNVGGTGLTATATLAADGTATASYVCNAATDNTCAAGQINITAKWNSVFGVTQLVLRGSGATGSDAGTSDGGGSDAGTSDGGTSDAGPADAGPAPGSTLAVAGVVPAAIITSDVANPGAGLPGTTTVFFVAAAPGGAPLANATLNVAEPLGETLVTLGAATATTDANGVARVTVTSLTQPGTAHIIAVLGAGLATATAAVPIIGPPTNIIETASVPTLLGLKGSGIQEQGTMTFKVTDVNGSAVPQVKVDFSQTQPALITFNKTTGTTDGNGIVVASYSSGSEVGVTSVSAKVEVAVNGINATASHTVAVRGAKPSGSHFYFNCSPSNLPVDTTTGKVETATCTVRLSDRNGNRVGVSTPVSFATEAGSITATAMTQAFNPANPTDPGEGTATVTFTTDQGNGSHPADVVPLAADNTQYPWPRAAEPQVASGSLVYNPRDRLVTIIAMTQGEEGFRDDNDNGVLDPGEIFYDQGDPFIDSNDDGVWDQVYPGGPFEPRFCGSTSGGTCPNYQGPNGKWDSLTTIWTPTWVVFTGHPTLTTTPAGGIAPANDFSSACLISTASASASAFANVYAYDQYLNPPAAGGTFAAPTVVSSSATPAAVAAKGIGFGTTKDNYGAMGELGISFDYLPVSPTGGPCVVSGSATAGTPCVFKLLFRNFDDGIAGAVEVDATGASGPSCKVLDNIIVGQQFTGAHSTISTGFFRASVAGP